MADHRPNVYLEESMVDGAARERLIIRASTLSSCTRALVLAGRGFPPQSPPEWMLERFNEGAAAEEPILAAFSAGEVVPSPREVAEGDRLGETKWRLLPPDDLSSYRDLLHVRPEYTNDGQYTAEIPVGDSAVLRGHLDGIAQVFQSPTGWGMNAGSRVVVESKDFGPDYWRDWTRKGLSAFPSYEMQLSIYMHATGLPGVMCVGQKIVGEGSEGERVISRGEVQYELFMTPPVSLGAIKARVAKLVGLIHGGAEIECSSRDFPCPFFWQPGGACSGEGVAGGEEVVLLDGEAAAELAVAVEGYRRGQEQEAAGKKLKAEWGPTIGKLVERHVGKGGKVRIRSVPQSNTCSTDGVTPEGDDGPFLVVTDYVQENKARVVEYKAGETRYPKIKIEKKKSSASKDAEDKGDG